MKLQRRKFRQLATSAAGLPVMPITGGGQTYPVKPVRIIVNLAPGGGTDFLARLVGEYVSRGMGQQVVIENKVGAGGLVGAEAAANSAADGYTLLASHDVVATAPPTATFNVDLLKNLGPPIQRSPA